MAGDKLLALQREMATRFGERFGWRVSDTFFTIEQLRAGLRNTEGIDDDWPLEAATHADFYTFKDGIPSAVVGHQYDIEPERLQAWASAHGLQAAFPDFSWWNPPRTRLVVYYASLRGSR